MTRHMLLVGRSRQLHAKAKELGLKLSILIPMSKLKSPNNMSLYHRVIGIPDNASVEEWIEAAQLIHRMEPLDAIGGFNEVTQEYAASIAQALDLPFHTPDVIRYTRDKDAMRQVLRSAGLDETASRLVEGGEDIEAFGAEHGYPLVLKPLDGHGSRGVSIIRSREDIAAALDYFGDWSTQYRMLAEQFLAGDEYSVEGFSEQGQHRVIAVTQKFKDPVTSVETGHCLPAPLPEEARAAVEDFVVRVLTALGIDNGPSHTEVILTPNGPRIVETHPRIGGDSIVDLLQLVYGVDLDRLWIRQQAGERVLGEIPSRTTQSAAISFVTPQAVGTLERVDGVEAAAAMTGVVQVEVLQDPGAEMQGATESSSRGACVIAVGEDGAEAVARAREAAKQLRFVISCAG